MTGTQYIITGVVLACLATALFTAVQLLLRRQRRRLREAATWETDEDTGQ